MRRALVLLLAAVVLLGCGQETGGPSDATGHDSPAPGGISGDYVADGLPTPYAGGDELRVSFGDGDVSFSATCNTFSGSASWDAGTLEVSGLGGTEMGCMGRGHDQDGWLADFFTSSPTITVDGTDVRLAAGDTEIRLIPVDEVAPDPGPDVELLGTRWLLVGIEETDGDTISMMDVRRFRAHLAIDKSSIGFDTGCNTGGGHAEVVDDRLRLGRVVTTLRGCLGARSEVEGGVMAVLGEKWVDWAIEGQELRLANDDTTLLYRAGRG